MERHDRESSRHARASLTAADTRTYYQALIAKDADYDGVFYVGVRTTGVFCRPTCPARKPKFEHCLFFTSAQEALSSSFRPCKRCNPLSDPQQVTELVKTIIEAVEAQPEKRWSEADFRGLSTNASTVRRQFKKRFGLTFVAYARARRMGLAVNQLKAGESVIGTQLASGYESGSGFRDAFSRVLGEAPSRYSQAILKAAWFDTRLGPMLAIADERALYLLEFTERRGLERELERLRLMTCSTIVPGESKPLRAVRQELEHYFAGDLKVFSTPTVLLGTAFQKAVWETLKNVPYGETRSYADIARAAGKPAAVRATARANGANQLALIVPCHRIVGADGKLTGYGGGLPRKGWLLEHERRNTR